jgi:hypothetical protein
VIAQAEGQCEPRDVGDTISGGAADRSAAVGEPGEDELPEDEDAQDSADDRPAQRGKKPRQECREAGGDHWSVVENLSALERESKSTM